MILAISAPAPGSESATAGLMDCALRYTTRGWLVIPLHSPSGKGCSCGRSECESPAKHPRTFHGLKDASREPATIREWWSRWPDANIGIVTGPDSGIFVLDVDGKQGEESLIDLMGRYGPLPDTLTVRTGGGGQHLYFLWSEGADVRNSQKKIAPGLDIRGRGGYVVAEPSVHKSGQPYEVTNSTSPALCPGWLVSLIQQPQAAQTRQSGPAAAALATAPIRKGARTPTLFKTAGKLRAEGVPLEAITETLLTLNKSFDPPLDEKRVIATAQGITRYPAGAPPQEPPTLQPDLIRLADVVARPVAWMWEPFIPLGMLSMLSGDPGAGKSFIALAVAAGLTRGRLLDGRIVDPAVVLYLSIENPLAQSIRPRFDALGGDPALFFALRGTLFTEDGEEQRGAVTLAHIPILEGAIRQTGARLVIVDPIQSYLGATVDLHRSNETRPVMDGLAMLAEKHDCAVLLLRHLSKQSGGKAIHRGLGSIDLTGAVRSEMLAGSPPDEPGTRALVHIKSNVGRLGNTIGFSIDAEGRFSWTGECSLTAADLLAAPAGPGDRKLAEASQWLSEQLREGSREQKELRKVAEDAGIAYPTLRRAKDALRVQAHKAGMRGPWMWGLPQGAHCPLEDAQEKSVSTFADLSTFGAEDNLEEAASADAQGRRDAAEPDGGADNPSEELRI